MAEGERKRTMVYSNVNRKADVKSASKSNEVIDLDNEIVIGLASFPKPDEVKNQKKNTNSKKVKSGQVTDKKKKVTETKGEKNYKTKSYKLSEKNIKSDKNSTKSQMTIQERIKRKKVRIIKKMSIIALMSVLILGGTIYFFLSPIFNVKSIEVLNNSYITSEQIINSSGIKINENILKFSKKEARNNILSNPYIEEVKISRNIFTDEVKIDIKERTATLMLEYGNSYVYINNQGYILEISSVKLDSPIIKGYVTPLEQVKPGNRLNKNDLGRLETVLSIIETANVNEIDSLITQIDISDTNDYIMVLESEDKTVHLGSCSNLAEQMPFVKEILKWEKDIEGDFFVDMDLNNGRPVFREKV